SAQSLQVLSRKLRLLGGEFSSFGKPLTAGALRQALLTTPDGEVEWYAPEAVPTLVQMLQVEGRGVRLLLVEGLGRVRGPGRAGGPGAAGALSDRAVFDPSEEVREAAARALAGRPADEYVGRLLAGLRYPWPPAADHAAEALAFLGRREVVPQLLALLEEPD